MPDAQRDEAARPEDRPRLLWAYREGSATDLLRAEAARFHGVPAERIVLGHECPRCGSDEHGRPLLLATSSLRTPAYVSLARAGAVSVVAVTDLGPVGIDLEAVGAAGFPGYDGVALHLHEDPSHDSTRAWVRKEALLKACGLGLLVDPRDVLLDEHGLVAWDSAEPRPENVQLQDIDVPGHVAALVVLPVVAPGPR